MWAKQHRAEFSTLADDKKPKDFLNVTNEQIRNLANMPTCVLLRFLSQIFRVQNRIGEHLKIYLRNYINVMLFFS